MIDPKAITIGAYVLVRTDVYYGNNRPEVFGPVTQTTPKFAMKPKGYGSGYVRTSLGGIVAVFPDEVSAKTAAACVAHAWKADGAEVSAAQMAHDAARAESDRLCAILRAARTARLNRAYAILETDQHQKDQPE